MPRRKKTAPKHGRKASTRPFSAPSATAAPSVPPLCLSAVGQQSAPHSHRASARDVAGSRGVTPRGGTPRLSATHCHTAACEAACETTAHNSGDVVPAAVSVVDTVVDSDAEVPFAGAISAAGGKETTAAGEQQSVSLVSDQNAAAMDDDEDSDDLPKINQDVPATTADAVPNPEAADPDAAVPFGEPTAEKVDAGESAAQEAGDDPTEEDWETDGEGVVEATSYIVPSELTVVEDNGALGVRVPLIAPAAALRVQSLPNGANKNGGNATSSAQMAAVQNARSASSTVLFGLMAHCGLSALWKATAQMLPRIEKAVEDAVDRVELDTVLPAASTNLQFDPSVWSVPTTLALTQPTKPRIKCGKPLPQMRPDEAPINVPFIALVDDEGAATPQLFFNVACDKLEATKQDLTDVIGRNEYSDGPTLLLALEDVAHIAALMTVASMDKQAAALARVMSAKKALALFPALWPGLVSFETPLMAALLRDVVAGGVKTCLSKITVDPAATLAVSECPSSSSSSNPAQGSSRGGPPKSKGKSIRTSLDSPRVGTTGSGDPRTGSVTLHFDRPSWGPGKATAANAAMKAGGVPDGSLEACYQTSVDVLFSMLDDVGASCATAVTSTLCPDRGEEEHEAVAQTSGETKAQHCFRVPYTGSLELDAQLLLCVASTMRQAGFSDLRDVSSASGPPPGIYARAFAVALVVLDQQQADLNAAAAQRADNTEGPEDGVPFFAKEAADVIARARRCLKPKDSPSSTSTSTLSLSSVPSLLSNAAMLCNAAANRERDATALTKYEESKKWRKRAPRKDAVLSAVPVTLPRLTAMVSFLRTEPAALLARAKALTQDHEKQLRSEVGKTVAWVFTDPITGYLNTVFRAELQAGKIAQAVQNVQSTLEACASRVAVELRAAHAAACRDVLRTTDTMATADGMPVVDVVRRAMSDAQGRCLHVFDAALGTAYLSGFTPAGDCPAVFSSCPSAADKAAVLAILVSLVDEATALLSSLSPTGDGAVDIIAAATVACGAHRVVTVSGIGCVPSDDEQEVASVQSIAKGRENIEMMVQQRINALVKRNCGSAFERRFEAVASADDVPAALAAACPVTAHVVSSSLGPDSASPAFISTSGGPLVLLDSLFTASMVAGVLLETVAPDTVQGLATVFEEHFHRAVTALEQVQHQPSPYADESLATDGEKLMAELQAVPRIVEGDTWVFQRCVVARRVLNTVSAQGAPFATPLTATVSTIETLNGRAEGASIDRAIASLRTAWQRLKTTPDVSVGRALGTALHATANAYHYAGSAELAAQVTAEAESIAGCLADHIRAMSQEDTDIEKLLSVAALGGAMAAAMPSAFADCAAATRTVVDAVVQELAAEMRTVPPPVSLEQSSAAASSPSGPCDHAWPASVSAVAKRYSFLESPDQQVAVPPDVLSAYRDLCSAGTDRVRSFQSVAMRIFAWVDSPQGSSLQHQAVFAAVPSMVAACLQELTPLVATTAPNAAVPPLSEEDCASFVDATVDALWVLHGAVEKAQAETALQKGNGRRSAEATAAFSALDEVVRLLTETAVLGSGTAPQARSRRRSRANGRVPNTVAVSLDDEHVAELKEVGTDIAELQAVELKRGESAVITATAALTEREISPTAIADAVATAGALLPRTAAPLVATIGATIDEAMVRLQQIVNAEAPVAAAQLRRTVSLAAAVHDAMGGGLRELLGPKSRIPPRWTAAVTTAEGSLSASLRALYSNGSSINGPAAGAAAVSLKSSATAMALLQARMDVVAAAAGPHALEHTLIDVLEEMSPLLRTIARHNTAAAVAATVGEAQDQNAGAPVLAAAAAAEIAAWAPPPALRQLLGVLWQEHVETAVRSLLAAVDHWENTMGMQLMREDADLDGLHETFGRNLRTLQMAAGRGLLLSDPTSAAPLQHRLQSLLAPAATSVGASSSQQMHVGVGVVPSPAGHATAGQSRSVVTADVFNRDRDFRAAAATLAMKGGSYRAKQALAEAMRSFADANVKGVATTQVQQQVLRDFVAAAKVVPDAFASGTMQSTVKRATAAIDALDRRAADAIVDSARAVHAHLSNFTIDGATLTGIRQLHAARQGNAPAAAHPRVVEAIAAVRAACGAYVTSMTRVFASLASAIKNHTDGELPNPATVQAAAGALNFFAADDREIIKAFGGVALPDLPTIRAAIVTEAHNAFSPETVRALCADAETKKAVNLITTSQLALAMLGAIGVGERDKPPAPADLFAEEAVAVATAACKAWGSTHLTDLNKRMQALHFIAHVAETVGPVVAPNLDRTVASCCGDVKHRVVSAMKTGAPAATTHDAVAERMKELASYYLRARHLEECVQEAMAHLLQRAPGKGTTQAVGSKLSRDKSPEAQAVLSLLPKTFDSIHRQLWRARAGEQSLETVIEAFESVERKPDGQTKPLSPERRGVLKEGLVAVNDAVTQALNVQEEGYDEVLKGHHSGIIAAAKKAKETPTRENMVSLVSAIVAGYTVRRSPEYFDSYEADALFRPHHAQVLALLKLLDLDAAPKTGIIAWAKSKLIADKVKARSQMAQIKTGEGKSITLAMLAAIYALLGYAVDIVCYSHDLTERDERDAQEFLGWLGVADEVCYETLTSLCERRLGAVRSRVQAAIDGKRLPAADASDDGQESVLLIDEVDVFCSRKFYGQMYFPVAILRRPEIADLIREIFANRDQLQKYEPESMQRALTATPALLRNHVSGMIANMCIGVKDFNFANPHFDPVRKLVGYKVADRIDYGIIYGDRTVFKYLSLVESGQMTAAEADVHLGINVSAGAISYAEEPLSYNAIVGVTGTLRTSGKKKTDLLTPATYTMLERYGITTFSYIPSVFGDGKEVTFNPAHDVYIRDTWADWLSEVERRCRSNTARGRGAVACFAKNKAMVERLRPDRADGARGWFHDVTFVWEDSSQKDRTSAINAVGNEGNVTAFTRAFARGTDFRMIDGVELTVLLLFVPSTLSEMAQAFGRTGRQGKSGRVEFVLCREQLEEKFGPCGYDHDAALRAKSQGTIDEYFATLQRKRTDEKEAVREEAYHIAKARHEKSRDKVRAICTRSCPDEIMRLTTEI